MSNVVGDAAAAASAGAAVGSVIPGLGTAAGAVIGGVGSLLYDGAKSVFNPNAEQASAPSELLNGQYVSLGKLGNKKQTRAMESEARLAALQQYYAQQNNQQDLENQMYLTRSTAALEAQGRRDAGLSTAGDFNGESVTSPQINSPSLPSAPQVDDTPSQMDNLNFVKDVSSLLSQLKVNDANARKSNSEADLLDTDKLTRYDENLARLDQQLQQNKISRVEYKRQQTALKYERDTLADKIKQQEEERKQAEFETQIKEQQKIQAEKQTELLEITNSLNKEQLKQAQFITAHQLEVYNMSMKEAKSRIFANIQSGYASKASAAASYAAARLSAKQTMLVDIERKLKEANIPYADRVASALADAADADANQKWLTYQLGTYSIPEARNSADYHNTLGGKFFDTVKEPFNFVLGVGTSAASIAAKVPK